jgi:heme-degrading monooxygenase HmoA
MARVFTHGVWVVNSGNEDAFVEAWSRLARGALSAGYRGEPPTLLRDRERSNVFKTFGAWQDVEAIEEFRGSDLFKDAVAELQPLLESFEPLTLDEIEWR